MAQDYNLGRVQGKGLWIADSTFTTSGTITLGSGFTISPLVEDYVIDKETNNVYAIATISGSNPFNFTTNGTPIFTLGGSSDIAIFEGTNTVYPDYRILESPINISGLTSIRLYPYTLNVNTFFVYPTFRTGPSYCDLKISMSTSISDSFSLQNFTVSEDLKTLTFTPITISHPKGVGSTGYTITNLNKIVIESGTLILYADNIEISTSGSSNYFQIDSLTLLDSKPRAISIDNVFIGYTNQGQFDYALLENRVSTLEQQIQAIAQIMEVDLTSLNKLTTKKEE